MKRLVYYLIPIVFMFALVATLVPWKTHYEQTLNAVCLDTSWRGNEIVSLEPIDEAVVEISIDRKYFLLDGRREANGTVRVSGYEALPYPETEMQYFTWDSDVLGDAVEYQYHNISCVDMNSKNSNSDLGAEYKIYYSTDLKKVMIKDRVYGQIFFCSAGKVDLEELMKYFEGCYTFIKEYEMP